MGALDGSDTGDGQACRSGRSPVAPANPGRSAPRGGRTHRPSLPRLARPAEYRTAPSGVLAQGGVPPEDERELGHSESWTKIISKFAGGGTSKDLHGTKLGCPTRMGRPQGPDFGDVFPAGQTDPRVCV